VLVRTCRCGEAGAGRFFSLAIDKRRDVRRIRRLAVRAKVGTSSVLTCLAGSASINSRQYPVLGRAHQNGCSDMLGLSGASMCCTPGQSYQLRGNTDRLPRAKPATHIVYRPAGPRRGAPRGSLSVESASRATSSPAQVRESPYRHVGSLPDPHLMVQ
jgi:hypothetical protein